MNTAQFISAAIEVGSSGSYQISEWRTYLIFVAVSTIGVLLNIFGYRILGRWNEGARKWSHTGNILSYFSSASIVLWSIVGCAVISITILATSSKNDASFVFTNFTNTTGWGNGMAWILGLLQSALSLIGYDAVAHMMEEMPRPTRDAPFAMVSAVVIGGVT